MSGGNRRPAFWDLARGRVLHDAGSESRCPPTSTDGSPASCEVLIHLSILFSPCEPSYFLHAITRPNSGLERNQAQAQPPSCPPHRPSPPSHVTSLRHFLSKTPPSFRSSLMSDSQGIRRSSPSSAPTSTIDSPPCSHTSDCPEIWPKRNAHNLPPSHSRPSQARPSQANQTQKPTFKAPTNSDTSKRLKPEIESTMPAIFADGAAVEGPG